VLSRHGACYFFSLTLMLKTIILASDFCSDQFDTSGIYSPFRFTVQCVTVCQMFWNFAFRVVYFNTRIEVQRTVYGLCIMVIHISGSTLCCY